MKKLGISENEWRRYIEIAKHIEINIDPGIKETAFLGFPTSNDKGTVINPCLGQELAALGIKPQALAYTKGIISLQKNDHTFVSLLSTEEKIGQRLEQIRADPSALYWFSQLIQTMKLLQAILLNYIRRPDSNMQAEIVIREQNRIYAELACYCLPQTFLAELKYPLYFTQYVAPYLGRYILTKL